MSSGQASRHMLLRRLMVSCPVTDGPVDTGFELSTLPAAGKGPHRLVDCTECGQEHMWTIEDAFLD